MNTNNTDIEIDIHKIPPPVYEDVDKEDVDKKDPDMILPNPWIKKGPPKFDIN